MTDFDCPLDFAPSRFHDPMLPRSVADAKPSSNHRDAAPTSKHRDGFAELSAQDQPNMARRAALFQGAKLAAEYAGMGRCATRCTSTLRPLLLEPKSSTC